MREGYGQFCPMAVACEVFAERWTPLVLRELVAGSRQFNQIHRGVPLMSRALLVRRLRDLEAAGVVERAPVPGQRGHEYRLTEAGLEFRPALEALGRWGKRWTVPVQRRNLDPGFLMWNVRRRIALDRLPEERVVVNVRFDGVPRTYRGPTRFWLVLERCGVQLCVEDPGLETQLVVEADLAQMANVWLGYSSFEEALRSQGLRLQGPARLAKAFPSWLMLSHYAPVPRPGVQSPLAPAAT